MGFVRPTRYDLHQLASPGGSDGILTMLAKLLNVLIVDDDKDNAESLAQLVALWGHDTRTALNGDDAFAAIDSMCPDVVVLDLAMPGMSGLELAAKVKERTSPKCP